MQISANFYGWDTNIDPLMTLLERITENEYKIKIIQ